MNKQQLEHLAWEVMKHVKRGETHSQIDIMKWLNVNVADAIEISNFLVEMGVCEFKD